MEMGKETGSITIGKNANLIITTKIPSYAYLPYKFGNQSIENVMINGQLI